jgi:ribonuclease H / adenosylcobalamin/alpha-ribazole phosphatase
MNGTRRVVVEADGGARGNPGPAGYGAVVRDADDRSVLAERSEFIGIATNNVAEYRGLIAGLRAAAEIGAVEVAVRLDSKLIVEQMKGAWQIKNSALRLLAREAVELRGRFTTVTFEWIPREQNRHADRLANQAMDRGARVPVGSDQGGAGPTPTAAPALSAAEPWIPSWAPPAEPGTRLILVRHGDTPYSGELRFCGSTDVPLTPLGEQQAAALAARAPAFGEVAAVVSSPLQRARRTAELIASAVGVPVGVDAQLAELDFGAWEGLTVDEAQALDPDAFARWLSSPDAAPPGGEPFAAARRYRRARDAVIAANPGRTSVVVAHVTPIKTIVRLALDAPPAALFRMHLDLASVSIVDYPADGSASMRLFNDTSHLD